MSYPDRKLEKVRAKQRLWLSFIDDHTFNYHKAFLANDRPTDSHRSLEWQFRLIAEGIREQDGGLQLLDHVEDRGKRTMLQGHINGASEVPGPWAKVYPPHSDFIVWEHVEDNVILSDWLAYFSSLVFADDLADDGYQDQRLAENTQGNKRAKADRH